MEPLPWQGRSAVRTTPAQFRRNLMSKKEVQSPVSIDVDDLTEVVGGLAFSVTPLNQTLVASSPLSSVAYNPDTCPTSPGTPVSTCMCPSAKIGNPGSIAINPAVRY